MIKPNWTLKKVKLSDLKDYHKNPRQLSEKQAEHLKKSVEKFGLIDKRIVNQDLTLIGGHQRKNVLNGEIKEIEVWFPDRTLDEKEVEELNIRLNANTGEFDFDILASDWDSTELIEWGMDMPEINEKSEPKEVELQGYEKVHILISFHPDKFNELEKHIEAIKKIQGIEYEQGAN